MEEVVDVGQAKPELAHKGAAVFVVALADVRQSGIGGLPQPLGEGEGVEAIGWRVAQILFQRAAVFACPNLVQRGLDDGVEVPAVCGENVERGEKDVVGQCSGEVEVFGRGGRNETTGNQTASLLAYVVAQHIATNVRDKERGCPYRDRVSRAG